MIINHDFGAARRAVERQLSTINTTGCDNLFVGFDMVPGLLFDSGWDQKSTLMPVNRFMSLAPETFAQMTPEVVFSPLIMGRFDVTDMADKLCEMGFSGRYRAVVDEIPSAWIVVSELRATYPAIDFDLIELRRKRAVNRR